MSENKQTLTIGSVTLKNRLVLAPMAGYTDAAMRELCAEAGAGLTVTEMVSVKGLAYSPERSEPLLIRSSKEQICAVQLFGHEPEFFELAVKLPQLSGFDIIDINMGCPVPKVVKNGEGSALLKNPRLAEEIVAATVKAANGRPVTVKTRIGFARSEDISPEFCKRIEGAGASAITLHGRTREQGYSGLSDWDKIERLRDALSVPVIGSGDANDKNAAELLKRADGVMIGRAAVGNSGIFARVLGTEEKRATMLEHYDLMAKYYGERYAFVNFRHHVGGYLRGMRGQKEIKLALFRSTSFEEMRGVLQQTDL